MLGETDPSMLFMELGVILAVGVLVISFLYNVSKTRENTAKQLEQKDVVKRNSDNGICACCKIVAPKASLVALHRGNWYAVVVTPK